MHARCEQFDDLENMQIRACKIAFPGLSYEECLSECSIPSLKARRHSVCKQFFQKMQSPKDMLHRLLPAEKANTKKTRNCSKYPLNILPLLQRLKDIKVLFYCMLSITARSLSLQVSASCFQSYNNIL